MQRAGWRSFIGRWFILPTALGVQLGRHISFSHFVFTRPLRSGGSATQSKQAGSIKAHTQTHTYGRFLNLVLLQGPARCRETLKCASVRDNVTNANGDYRQGVKKGAKDQARCTVVFGQLAQAIAFAADYICLCYLSRSLARSLVASDRLCSLFQAATVVLSC